MAKATATCAVVIPARLASTRLPRKLLLSETGSPLIEHTYRAASAAGRPSLVCVATEDEEIRLAVAAFGGNCLMTSAGLASGTERVAEVAAGSLTHVDIIVNVQGDEPEIEPAAIDQMIALLDDDPQVPMATLAAPIFNERDLYDPACVKVVTDEAGRALYFSRSPIPCPRDGLTPEMFQPPAQFYQHLGVYAYRREFLLGFVNLPASPLECTECLEQLRVLAAGIPIRVGMVPQATRGIDTLEDYRRFVSAHQQRSGQAA